MKTLAIVQARLGGTRFPEKVFEKIYQRPMYQDVLCRAALVVGDPRCVVLAVPYGEKFSLNWPEGPIVQGPEADVLTRFVRVVEASDADCFIRFTADCPLLDVGYSQHLLGLFQYLRSEGGRQITPELLATSPDLDGLDTEIFTRHAIMEANDHARGTDREHVTSWMRRHIPTQIATMPLLGGPIRWSVDDASGLEFVRRVVRACPDCALAVPHHSNAGSSIGGADRSMVLDLHVSTGGGLVECLSADILRTRLGNEWGYSSAT